MSTNECEASIWQAVPNRMQAAMVLPQVLNAECRKGVWNGLPKGESSSSQNVVVAVDTSL